MIDRASRNAPRLLLGAALLASAVLILVLVRHLTYFADSWEFLMNRRHFTADAVLQPHNEHIVVIPVLITQLFLRIFGMTSAMPEFVVLVIGLLATAVLLFEFIRRRIGPWPALFAAALLLFLGPADEVLLWSFEIAYVGSLVFGLAMLLALESRTRRGDVIACVCLILSFGFSSLGIAFLLAAAVAILIRPRSTWRERAFVVVIPAVLYAIWWLGWGHNAETHLTLHNILSAPSYVAESIAAGVGALSGLGTNPSSLADEPTWGRIILVAIAIGLALVVRHRKRVDPVLWPVATAAFANWVLAALNDIAGREPTVSRYQYVSAIFVLMIVASLLSGTRLSKRVLIVGGVLAALAIGPNLVVLHKGKEHFAAETVLTRSDTAALEIARQTVPPQFELAPEVAGTGALIDVQASKYFEAVDEFGSPAYSQSELEAAPPAGRKQADIILATVLPITTEIQLGADAGKSGCTSAGGTEGATEVPLAPGSDLIEVPAGTEAKASLRRFSEVGEFPISLSAIPPEAAMKVSVPHDESSRPWVVHIESAAPVEVCGS
ncbi:MAG TPA: hypothetical protein VGC32_01900 [Solirubrobacterales bacterium]